MLVSTTDNEQHQEFDSNKRDQTLHPIPWIVRRHWWYMQGTILRSILCFGGKFLFHGGEDDDL